MGQWDGSGARRRRSEVEFVQTQAHRVAATDGRRAASVTEVSERHSPAAPTQMNFTSICQYIIYSIRMTSCTTIKRHVNM